MIIKEAKLMYRVNNATKQMVKLQVVQDGKLHAVNLLPGKFVLTDELTNQIMNLEKNRAVKTHAVPNRTVPKEAKPVVPTSKVPEVTKAPTTKVAPIVAEAPASVSVEDTGAVKEATDNTKKKAK